MHVTEAAITKHCEKERQKEHLAKGVKMLEKPFLVLPGILVHKLNKLLWNFVQVFFYLGPSTFLADGSIMDNTCYYISF